MVIVIEPHGTYAIYEQIVNQIKNQIISGELQPEEPIILIPGCFLGGAAITLFCDGIARTVFAPTEISISSVTAVFLVPVVIAAMLRKQRM